MDPFLRKKLLTINRKLSWVLTFITMTQLTIGYVLTRTNIDRALPQPIHIYLGFIYAIFIIAHFMLSIPIIGLQWRELWKNPERLLNQWTLTRAVQRLSGWVLIIGSFFLILTGLGWDDGILWLLVPFEQHLHIDELVGMAFIVHLFSGIKSFVARNKVPFGNRWIIILGAVFLITIISIDNGLGRFANLSYGQDDTVLPEEYIDSKNTAPEKTGSFRLGYVFSGNSKRFIFNPDEVMSLRSDIFKPGYFSMFDVLVHVAHRGDIDLEYHFDESMNTYVIDSLEGKTNWWYEAYYDGGWPESNFFRMDHFPWKDGSSLTFIEKSPERIEDTYNLFREEIKRLKENNGKAIIPNVYISGIYDKWQYHDVEVIAHNVRSDMFQPGVITALDVILSLGDQKKLNYTLQWYQSIGDARIVMNYWVENINEDKAEGRCGFVHEEGSITRLDRGGNHIHIPSDIKPLNSPEYAWWFYICI